MTAFGQTLRHWRGLRRLSQLNLAMEAETSPRHLSFLETGRARPSREMVARLAEALEVPLPARNAMLADAGFAARHARSPMEAEAMAPIRDAVARILERHDPWPAMAIDPLWRLQLTNHSAGALLSQLGLGPGDSLLVPFTQPGYGPAIFENWGEVGQHMLHRLRAESRALGGEPALDRVIETLSRDEDVRFASGAADGPALAFRYCTPDGPLAFVSTIMQFQGAHDIAVADLRVEMLFPADDATRTALEWEGDAPRG